MHRELLDSLGITQPSRGVSTGAIWYDSDQQVASISPADGSLLGSCGLASAGNYEQVIQTAQEGFKSWRARPAPKRGEVVLQLGDALRANKENLGRLVSYECGKSYQEGLGEVQEMIDICGFAAGLSRQLYGMTMHSERPGHRMYEQYHPLGLVGIISAFNFPVAVWAWNTAIAWVCGDVCIWKPSEKTPLTAIACQNLVNEVFAQNDVPEGVSSIVVGGAEIGRLMAADRRVPLVSATGSTRMGKAVNETVAKRLGRALLELGGNNAVIVSKDCDMDVAVRAAVFGAVGTAGQRCTSTRRLIVHEDIYDALKERMAAAYRKLKIGNPLNESNHVGPLIDTDAVETYRAALEQLKAQGALPVIEGGVLTGEGYESGCYVKPAIYEVDNSMAIVRRETFAPILYLMKYSDLGDAIDRQNDVPQGLSSAIVTNSLAESELFLSHAGSDCGIANVNIGTSGAEIGGAFGGEKETGGGREAGSDAWKVYMRRQTNTINYSGRLPLAQGIKFEL